MCKKAEAADQTRKKGVAGQWDELRQAGEAGGEFWKLLNHPATMQRRKKSSTASTEAFAVTLPSW
ncbi:MAG: hypothetical protein RM347_022115 [Nostoc sp. ChiQUE02]|uniref:hypothetical protein n=1 Tax=Nostoc sp. ChiQUE02 TaxID=3075377 RepID=UPI002AD3BB91|nr:hypothetical protein [Nostoc sp. ChiQUE02]MDZ8228696.1 hypothetical protein [Nostoc sp. ChiQUE02]